MAVDDRDRMTGAALRSALAAVDADGELDVFAVAAVGRHHQRRCGRPARRHRRRVRRPRHLAARRRRLRPGRAVLARRSPHGSPGIERADSFGVDPHKWLFAPYDCAALVYPRPGDRGPHPLPARRLPRRGEPRRLEPERLRLPPVAARAAACRCGSRLATYGTDAYADGDGHHAGDGRGVRRRRRGPPGVRPAARTRVVDRAVPPSTGGRPSSTTRGASSGPSEGVALVVPTKWHGETVHAHLRRAPAHRRRRRHGAARRHGRLLDTWRPWTTRSYGTAS